jgi:hypothetical protein
MQNVESDSAAGATPTCDAAPFRRGQAFLNLFANALEAWTGPVRVPGIVISGRHEAGEASAAGARIVRLLPKPVKDAELRSVVESVAAGAAVTGADYGPPAGRVSISRGLNIGPLPRAPMPCDSALDLLLPAAVEGTELSLCRSHIDEWHVVLQQVSSPIWYRQKGPRLRRAFSHRAAPNRTDGAPLHCTGATLGLLQDIAAKSLNALHCRVTHPNGPTNCPPDMA